MRRKVVAGNWKMNGSSEFARAYCLEISSHLPVDDIDVVLFPPFPYLGAIALSDVALGAQDCSVNASGAFTGDVSAEMLRDIGARYVLVGHSERRVMHGESDELVAQKCLSALKADLVPVLCVGESMQEREAGAAFDVVSRQVNAVLSVLSKTQLKKLVVAYEPVWAIGTGLTATPDQAQEMHQFIRANIANVDAEGAEAVSILYGGSVKSDNACELFAKNDIDGALVGGASLKVEEFIAICRARQQV